VKISIGKSLNNSKSDRSKVSGPTTSTIRAFGQLRIMSGMNFLSEIDSLFTRKNISRLRRCIFCSTAAIRATSPNGKYVEISMITTAVARIILTKNKSFFR
jgi:hypothetical protein